ncbi:GNAT family N-acetyltransferase [Candidatus Bipolaricaulota bacterium]|nr:GNAT family N-acetyltransferase [Candidatus Bipolaricaulota bacterium]
MTLPLQTDRLIIRRFTSADIDDIIAFTAHPSVARETTNIPREDRAKMTEYIEIQSGYSLFETQACVDLACELKETGEVIGLLSLVSNGKQQGEIGWGFSIDHRRQGLATEAARRLITYAFEECGYHRIFAGTVFTNTRSWALMERVGMRKEAHFVKAHVPAEEAGEWIDTVRYAVLAEEWGI